MRRLARRISKIGFSATLLGALFAPATHAQVPRLLADVNQESYSYAIYTSGMSSARYLGLWSSNWIFESGSLAQVGGWQYFVLNEPECGAELWRTLGTASSTERVADIRKGKRGSEPLDLTPYGNKLLFTADDGVHGRELWISDGTALGTRMLKELTPGPEGSTFRDVTVCPFGIAFCLEAPDSSSSALWRSDGTAAGTKPFYAPAVQVGELQWNPFRNELWFFQSNGKHWGQTPIYVSDGTMAGTKALPGSSAALHWHSFWRAFSFTPTHAFYQGASNNGSSDLFSYEFATAKETRVATGTATCYHRALAGKLLFQTDPYGNGTPPSPNALWVSDGTVAGTKQLAVLPARGQAQIGLLQGSESWLWKGSIVFELWFGGSPMSELWQSDGSAAGTHRMKHQLSRGHGWALSSDGTELYASDYSSSLGEIFRWQSSGWESIRASGTPQTNEQPYIPYPMPGGRMLFEWRHCDPKNPASTKGIDLFVYDARNKSYQSIGQWQDPVTNKKLQARSSSQRFARSSSSSPRSARTGHSSGATRS